MASLLETLRGFPSSGEGPSALQMPWHCALGRIKSEPALLFKPVSCHILTVFPLAITLEERGVKRWRLCPVFHPNCLLFSEHATTFHAFFLLGVFLVFCVLTTLLTTLTAHWNNISFFLNKTFLLSRL